jgi:hypothetical protein
MKGSVILSTCILKNNIKIHYVNIYNDEIASYKGGIAPIKCKKTSPHAFCMAKIVLNKTTK